MTTIVVHGTLAYGGSWYQDSWERRGFLAGLSSGMQEASGRQDIWLVDGEPVSTYPELNEVFKWNGLPEGFFRGAGAKLFAEYLNKISDLTDEPVRIIAHSHGCNVVKLASSLPSLSPNVYIDKAVFLACPHFYEDKYTQDNLSWQDRLDFRKVSRGYKKTGYRFRYPLDSNRFGRILNIYCEKDKVQVDLASSLSGGQVPLTGNFLENIMSQFTSGAFELPMASRCEMDQNSAHLYENLEVFVKKQCSGTKTHSVMHGYNIARIAGNWLNRDLSIRNILSSYGSRVSLSCDDTGD